jgi:hypothetical protein
LHQRDNPLPEANLTKADWSLGYVLAIDSNGRTIFVADAHRDDGKRFVVRSAFLDLERITHKLAVSALLGDDSNWSKASQVGLVRL